MPRQPLVFAANTMDFWRNAINGLASNINYGIANTFSTTGNIRLTGSGITLNVVNGSIRANGTLLTSLNALAMFGVANNSRLQNTTFNVMTTAGISGGANGIALGSIVVINVSVADSITNTRTDIPASANSVLWAMQKANVDLANATLVTSTVDETRGGLGESTYSEGSILIGNSFSGKLEKTTFTPGRGIAITTANGSVTVSANLVQGSGISLSSSGNSGITVSANGYTLANSVTDGLVILTDRYDSVSTSNVATSNAVNSVSLLIKNTPGNANLIGRMIDKRVYTTANQAGGSTANGTAYTWTKPANTSWFRVICIGGGGGGGNTFNTDTLAEACIGTPGHAGQVKIWTGVASNVGSTVDLYVGGGGVNYGSNSTSARAGGRSHFGASFLTCLGGIGGAEIRVSVGSAIGFANVRQSIHRTADPSTSGTIPNDTFFDENFEILSMPGDLSWWQNQPTYTFALGTNDDSVCYAIAGQGGSTFMGRGGLGGIIAGVPLNNNTYWCHGQNALGYGSGGGGCVSDWNCNTIAEDPNSLGFVRGGNGAPGIVIVESYSLN
jgi:hypothetical protein